MPAQVATKYRVEWSAPIRMWKSSFKTALFSYGLPIEDILVDEMDLTVIRKRNLYTILEKMKGDLQTHYITETVTVESVTKALQRILTESDSSLEEVRILWDRY